MYKVIKTFTDLQDNNYKYGVGDEYPRSGLKVSKKRIEELSTTNNRRGCVFIIPVEDTERHTEEPQDEQTGETPTTDVQAQGNAKKKARKGGKSKDAE